MGKCKKEKSCDDHKKKHHDDIYLPYGGNVSGVLAATEYLLYPFKTSYSADVTSDVEILPTTQFDALNKSIALPNAKKVDDILVTIASEEALGVAVTYTLRLYAGINPLSALGATVITTKTVTVPASQSLTKVLFPVSLEFPEETYFLVSVASSVALAQFDTDIWVSVTLQ